MKEDLIHQSSHPSLAVAAHNGRHIETSRGAKHDDLDSCIGSLTVNPSNVHVHVAGPGTREASFDGPRRRSINFDYDRWIGLSAGRVGCTALTDDPSGPSRLVHFLFSSSIVDPK